MFGLFSAAGIETTAETGIVQILLKMLLLLMLANIVMLQKPSKQIALTLRSEIQQLNRWPGHTHKSTDIFF
jgi:hypothetical protein